jgi:hypothetical protein
VDDNLQEAATVLRREHVPDAAAVRQRMTQATSTSSVEVQPAAIRFAAGE